MSKKLHFLMSTLAVAILSPHIAHAAEDPLRLEPSSKWVMRHKNDSCRLVRLFGEGDDKMMLVLTRFGPSARFRMTLAGEPVKIHSDRRPLKVQFGAHEEEQRIPFALGEAGGLPALVAIKQVRIDGAAKATKANRLSKMRYAAVEFMKIRVGQKRPVFLETGSLAGPFDAMRTCTNKLMASWGVDAEQHRQRRQSVRPIGKAANWLRSSDYPSDMLRERQPALINFRLSVDENGKATACHIQQTTRPKEFDDAVCEGLIKRSAFSPALDAEGKPMASFWRNQVRFSLNN
ncbi:hypothetical protein [Parasphingorhabdus sp.]|uniref:energy transducer TonB n=1 Tax=Parasphingorhabdus sp. TaxID=2709688 RepID=UPI003265F0B0